MHDDENGLSDPWNGEQYGERSPQASDVSVLVNAMRSGQLELEEIGLCREVIRAYCRQFRGVTPAAGG